MELAADSDNSERPCKLIRNSGGRRTSEAIHGRQKGLDRRAKHFNVQFSWPHANAVGPTVAASNFWEVSLYLPTEVEHSTSGEWKSGCI